MLYDRKIKYVDYYENGERVKGGGFVKLEVCDSVLKMNLNIRGLHSTDSFTRDVVLKGLDKEGVLGQIVFQEGTGSFNYSCELTGGIGSTGISYEELQEIKIPVGGSRELCCMLGKMSNKAAVPDKSLEEERREPEAQAPEAQEPEDQAPEAQAPEAQEPEAQNPEVQNPEAQEPEAQEPEAENPEVQEPEMQEDGLQDTETHLSEEPETEHHETKYKETKNQEELRQVELQQSEYRKAEAPEIKRRETKAAASEPEGQEPIKKEQSRQEEKPAVKLLEDKWQQLSAIYQHIRPFQDEREYLSLSPSDFVMFPESYYRAANNSFLLHGFYNYKHLILARIEVRGEARYYLGVPGNYYEREKQVAVMFGFESFECAREPAKTGDFGYYMMRMEL